MKQPTQLLPYRPKALRYFEPMTFEEYQTGGTRTFAVDVELYENYFLCGFLCLQSFKIIQFEITPNSTFNEMLLSEVMFKHTTIGFNSINFDLPLIWYAIKTKDLSALRHLAQDIIFGEARSTYRIEKEYDFKVHQTPHIDLIAVCPLTGSLKTYGGRLHAARIQDLPFDPMSSITWEEAQIVKAYNCNDLETTGLIASNLSEQLKLRQQLGEEYRTNLLSKSDPQVAEAIVATELKRVTGKYPKPPKSIGRKQFKYKIPSYIYFESTQMREFLELVGESEFEVLESGRVVAPPSIQGIRLSIDNQTYTFGKGGLHSTEKCATYWSSNTHILKDVDVTSYYPKVILNQSLYPEHLGEEFLHVYNAIYERRVAAKKAKNYAVSEGLKIAVNGVFGKFGSPFSIVYSPIALIQTTLTGQLSILMIIEQYALAGIRTVSANTDGVLAYVPREKLPMWQGIIKAWEYKTGFETEETEYASYHARDVNAYLAIKTDGTVKGKGPYVNPWADKKLAIFRFHKNPKSTICIRAVTEYITKQTPIETTVRNSRDIREFVSVRNVPEGAHQNGEYLGKVVRFYYSRGNYNTINKIKSGAMVSESQGAKPCMDLPEQFPNDIDYEYYINQSYRILEDIGHSQTQGQLLL